MQNKYNDKERLIVKKLWGILDASKCSCKISEIKKIQLDFFVDAILRVCSNKDRNITYDNFIKYSLLCAELTNLKIVSNDNEPQIKYQNGLIVISNHLGSNKNTKITNEELTTELMKKKIDKYFVKNFKGFINDDPFIILVASVIKTIQNVVDLASSKLSIALIDFPFPISEVALDSNHFMINRKLNKQYKLFEANLIQKTIEAKRESKLPIFIIFPEGGTSGKNNFQSPYMLNNFHNGYALYAFKNRVPILPIVQVFNNEFNFFTKILKMQFIKNETEITSSTIQLQMQNEINSLINEDNNYFWT